MVNQDLLANQWKSLRPRIKERWHALTDDDLKLIAGDRTVLANVLCERYAYTEEQAQKQVDQFVSDVSEKVKA